MFGFEEKLIAIAAQIKREIVYIIYVRPVQICRKIKSPKQQKFNLKLCTIHVRNIWICRKIEPTKLRKFDRKFCTLYLYKMFGFAEKLIA